MALNVCLAEAAALVLWQRQITNMCEVKSEAKNVSLKCPQGRRSSQTQYSELEPAAGDDGDEGSAQEEAALARSDTLASDKDKPEDDYLTYF